MRHFIDAVENQDSHTLLEADVRASMLYHSTEPDNALKIIKHGSIEPRTVHISGHPVEFRKDEIDEHGNVNGISLTRDIVFARRWKDIVFGFNRETVEKRFRLVPVNFWGSRGESEEFIPNSSLPLDPYLVEILMPKRLYQYLQFHPVHWMKFENKYAELIGHPKFRIQGSSWEGGKVIR